MLDNLKFRNTCRDLDHEELEKLIAFVLYINTNSNNTRLIYRGENYQCLKNKLDLFGDDDYKRLSNFIFLIGDKGRTYRKSYREKIKDKNKVYPIDCIEDTFFENIFLKMVKILKNTDKPEIIRFHAENSIFKDYFSSNSNKTDFVEKLRAITNDKEKIKIRDYYLSLMHQIGRIGFYNNSFFTSTSFDYYEAIHFAANDFSSEKIIFVSWVKYPQSDVGISFNYLNNASRLIKNNQLPYYNISFFPKQKEFAVKGGLLPHYILGYLKVDKNEFEINPNLFYTKKSFDEIIKNGFDIDQSGFHDTLDQTDYKGYFIFNLEGDYIDINE